jgi:two-component system alkaline phosphatase synthesis response regulator PhoP
MSKRIFVVEDEPGLRQSLVDCLNVRRYEVHSSRDGETALRTATATPFDLIILDVMLPAMDGFEVCRTLRESQVLTPVLMLTARHTLQDKIEGLRGGADDYVTKPFEMDELLARIEALLRRSSVAAPKESYEVRGIQIDLKNSRIVRDGRTIDLSRSEARLLRYFLEHRDQTLSRPELLKAAWGYDFAPLSRTVDVHVAWLRQKLEKDPADPRVIVTVRGEGYRFEV